MASQTPKLTVVISDDARRTLDHIWSWNATHYDSDHAFRYISFLIDETEQLATTYLSGRPVPTNPNLRYVIIRRRRKGHGHLAVYELVGDRIHVLDYFHTAQDWTTVVATPAP